MVARNRLTGPESLGLPPETPGEPLCGAHERDRCIVEFVTWHFTVAFRVEPVGGQTGEPRSLDRSRAALLARLSRAEKDLVECGRAAMRRDMCLGRHLGVGARVAPYHALTPRGTEGEPDPTTIACIGDELRRLQLRRVLDPETHAVEVFVRLVYHPPHYEALHRAFGDTWVGPVKTRRVDVPCRQFDPPVAAEPRAPPATP